MAINSRTIITLSLSVVEKFTRRKSHRYIHKLIIDAWRRVIQQSENTKVSFFQKLWFFFSFFFSKSSFLLSPLDIHAFPLLISYVNTYLFPHHFYSIFDLAAIIFISNSIITMVSSSSKYNCCYFLYLFTIMNLTIIIIITTIVVDYAPLFVFL